jgi:anti-sigma28 factor (negative regulator of flagellin synthesis)
MFPKLSNIEGKIWLRIKQNGAPSIASKLNAWIRVFSGAQVNGKDGLLMQSNTNAKLFKAAGDKSASIYGNLQGSGVLGTDWKGNPVETGVGRILRPSPIVTGFTSKEGKDQISRHATLELKAFSLEQMEAIQSYFLEPGYSLYIEWGWNTEKGTENITTVDNSTEAGTLVSKIAEKSLNWNSLIKTRHSSLGEFDCFLGFIVGGNVTNDGETFNITVNLRGAPSLPTYLQGYQGTSKIESGVVVNNNKVKQLYTTAQLEDETQSNGIKRRFAAMFNDLPAFRQTTQVKALETSVAINQFINFDKLISNNISEGLNDTGVLNWTNDEDVVISNVSISKEKLFSNERYIRMDLAVLILNTIGAVDTYVIGGKEISFKIDIESTVIGSFPYMFSTKADKLIIPGYIPDFKRYYLQSNTVEQLGGGTSGWGKLRVDGGIWKAVENDDQLEFFAPKKPLAEYGYKEDSQYWGYLRNLFVNFDMFVSKLEQKNKNTREIFLDILNEMSAAVNSFWNFQIVEGEFKPANRPPAATWTADPNNPLPASEQLRAAAARDFRLMGATNNTYVPGQGPVAPNTSNVVTITTNTGTVATISNKMTPGDVVITVIDENFMGKNPYPKKDIVKFDHIGSGCVFLESNLDISMPADMTNKIIMTRLEASANPDAPFMKVGGFFNSAKDLFLQNGRGANSTGETFTSGSATTPPPSPADQLLEQQVNEFSKWTTKTSGTMGSSTTSYYKEDNNGAQVFVFSETTYAGGSTIVGDGAEAAKFKKLQDEVNKADKNKVNELKTAIAELKKANLSSYIDKVSAMPNPKVQNRIVNKEEIKTLIESGNYEKLLTDNFCFYTFDDTEYFDRLKNDALGTRVGGSLSQPLPIKYSFKILGNSGIRRGDMFNIFGIPDKYRKHGLFQVTEIEHSFDGNLWVTNITGDYRQEL